VAGIHLMDPASGEYNRPFLTPGIELVRGYARMQGVVYRTGDRRFEGRTAAVAIAQIKDDPDCAMVNRNQGSGTRILIDRLLAGSQPAGYAVQSRSHNAVAAAVSQSRADWGVAIQYVAVLNGLGFLPLQQEQFDLAIPGDRLSRPAVAALVELLRDEETIRELALRHCLIA
jgi:putative molybdopterin biosynthesis protein